jgi:hypothetical protein
VEINIGTCHTAAALALEHEGVPSSRSESAAASDDSSNSGSSLKAVESLEVRPVGLRSGTCEVEVQLPLSAVGIIGRNSAASSSAGLLAGSVLLSTAAPLLVLRCSQAVAEVQALLQCSGDPGVLDF